MFLYSCPTKAIAKLLKQKKMLFWVPIYPQVTHRYYWGVQIDSYYESTLNLVFTVLMELLSHLSYMHD